MDELDTNLLVRDEMLSPRVRRTSYEVAMTSKALREVISYVSLGNSYYEHRR